MEMMSPDSYIKEKLHFTIEQLIEEKSKLENSINEIESQVINNIPDIFNVGRDTKLKMEKQYLQKIEELILQKQ